jgi:phosphohistidine phosphatase
MRLLFLRHAIAAPLGKPARRDHDRQLTPAGERRFRQTARALAHIAPKPRAILTSPLLRARQTAEIAAQAWGAGKPIVVAALAGGDWDGICRALAGYADRDTVVVVGHEDWMSRLTARMLGSRSGGAFDIRKGGVALVEVKALPSCRGTLLWFIPPRVFRKLRGPSDHRKTTP